MHFSAQAIATFGLVCCLGVFTCGVELGCVSNVRQGSEQRASGTLRGVSGLGYSQGTLAGCRNDPWLCAGYDSESAWRQAIDAARAAKQLVDVLDPAQAEADADSQTYEPGFLCGQLGIFCASNWALEQARHDEQRARLEGSPKDLCQILSEMLEDAKRRSDVDSIRDIVQAEKFSGCRNKQKRKSHY